MFCEECGTKIEEGLLFCPNCGAKVGSEPIPSFGQEGTEDDEKTSFLSTPSREGDGLSEDPAVSRGSAAAYQDPAAFARPEAREGSEETQSAAGMWQKEGAYQKSGAVQSGAGMQTAAPGSGDSVFCPHCGAMNHGGDLFCANCGGSLDGTSAPTPARPGKSGKVVWLIGGGVAMLILVCMVIGGIFMMSGRTGGHADEVYYIKDSSLYRSSLKKVGPEEIDDDLLDKEVEAATAYIGEKLSANEQYLFYFHIDDDGVRTLYYIDTKDKKREPQKIDSDIQSAYYEVTPDNRVIYCKNDNLYIHDLKDKEKITSDVNSFYVAQNGKNLIWTTIEDSRLYTQDTDMKKEKEKLDSDIDYVYFTSPELDHIVYLKEGSIYMIENLQEKEKIASDTLGIVTCAYDKDHVSILYGEGEEEEQMTLWDFVKDDMSEDADMEEPREEDYQTTRTRSGWGGVREITETDDKYYEMLNAYYEKLSRDELREELRQTPLSLNDISLKLYNSATDDKVTVVEGCIGEVYDCESIGGKTVVTYTYIDEEEFPSLKFSEVCDSGIEAAENKLFDELDKSGEKYLAVGDNTEKILDEDKVLEDVESDGERLFVIVCEENSDGKRDEYELGEISVKSGDFGSYSKLYSDASDLLSCENGALVYVRDYDAAHETCDLYLNDAKIDSDVYIYSVHTEDNGHILYYKDWEDGCGTLKLFNGKESEKIANDTKQALYYSDNKIAVLTDFSKKSRKGDLKLYNGKELEKIDTDVSRIIIL